MDDKEKIQKLTSVLGELVSSINAFNEFAEEKYESKWLVQAQELLKEIKG